MPQVGLRIGPRRDRIAEEARADLVSNMAPGTQWYLKLSRRPLLLYVCVYQSPACTHNTVASILH